MKYSQSHVFGVALAETNPVAVLHKRPDGSSVSRAVACCKALIGHVEKGKVALL